MILEEIKLYKAEKFKIVAFFLISILIFFCANYAVSYVKNNEESLVMSIATVNNDDEQQMQYFLNILNRTELGKRFDIKKAYEEEARKMILQNEISAYVIIPDGFIESVYTGHNLPLSIVGNENEWIESTIIKLAMNAATSYLTTAQSGIYATIDTAYELGATKENVNDILMPINISYGTSLLSYENIFEKETINVTGNQSIVQYYVSSAIIFFMIISIAMYITNIQETTEVEILNKYKSCGIKLKTVLMNKFVALFIIIFLYSFPIFYFFNLKGILVILLTASIAFFVSVISNKSFGIINVLFISFFSLFISGGIIPLLFLPKVFNFLAKLTPNYWVININNGFMYVFGITLYIISLNTLSYVIINRRLGK